MKEIITSLFFLSSASLSLSLLNLRETRFGNEFLHPALTNGPKTLEATSESTTTIWKKWKNYVRDPKFKHLNSFWLGWVFLPLVTMNIPQPRSAAKVIGRFLKRITFHLFSSSFDLVDSWPTHLNPILLCLIILSPTFTPNPFFIFHLFPSLQSHQQCECWRNEWANPILSRRQQTNHRCQPPKAKNWRKGPSAQNWHRKKGKDFKKGSLEDCDFGSRKKERRRTSTAHSGTCEWYYLIDSKN